MTLHKSWWEVRVLWGAVRSKKPDLGEISRPGKSYCLKFFSETLHLPGQILLFWPLLWDRVFSQSPPVSQVPGVQMSEISLTFRARNRLKKGQVLWKDTHRPHVHQAVYLCSPALTFWCRWAGTKDKAIFELWEMSQRAVFLLGPHSALGLISTYSAPTALSSTLKSLLLSQHLPPYASHLEKKKRQKTSYGAGRGGSHVSTQHLGGRQQEQQGGILGYTVGLRQPRLRHETLLSKKKEGICEKGAKAKENLF